MTVGKTMILLLILLLLLVHLVNTCGNTECLLEALLVHMILDMSTVSLSSRCTNTCHKHIRAARKYRYSVWCCCITVINR
jgi:hypothetical protein